MIHREDPPEWKPSAGSKQVVTTRKGTTRRGRICRILGLLAIDRFLAVVLWNNMPRVKYISSLGISCCGTIHRQFLAADEIW